MRDKEKGIGISWLWMLPEEHPFFPAASWHDDQYDLRAAGLLDDTNSAEVDRYFYAMMREIAGDSLALKVQAWTFYKISRAWGILNWPTPGKEE